jgi:hypothetical protein
MALGSLTSLSRGDLGYMSGSLKFHHVEPRRFEVLDALRRSYVGRKMVPASHPAAPIIRYHTKWHRLNFI